MYAEGDTHVDLRDEWSRDNARPAISEDRPLTPGGEIVSDELSFAKWNKKKKNKVSIREVSRLRDSIVLGEANIESPEAGSTKKNKRKVSHFRDSVVPGEPSTESPETAFAAAVNKDTGFSPLNPTAPLHDVFPNAAAPPREKPALLLQTTPVHSPPPRREFLRERSQSQVHSPVDPGKSPVAQKAEPAVSDPEAKRLAGPRSEGGLSEPRKSYRPTISNPDIGKDAVGTPRSQLAACLSPVPRLPTPASHADKSAYTPLAETPAVPARKPFEAVRPELFQKALVDSIRGIKFDDTRIYLCSARSKAGVAHKPLAVHARSDFLHAASAVFTEGTRAYA
jgi:hypothetical protein